MNRILASVYRMIGHDVKMTNVNLSMNPFGEFTAQEAVHVHMKKEKLISEIIVVSSCGPPQSQETIRTAYADRDRSGSNLLQPVHVPKIFVKLPQNVKADIIMGKQTIDGMIASSLNVPWSLVVPKRLYSTVMIDWESKYKELGGKYDVLKEENHRLEEKCDALVAKCARIDEKLKHMQGFVGAVASRSFLDDVFLVKIKMFLPAKEPGKPYTGPQIQKAYIQFFDSNDEFATALRREFPDLTKKKLARKIRDIYGNLSLLDHTLFALLQKDYNVEKIGEFIQMVPSPFLEPVEKEMVRRIICLYMEIVQGEGKEDNEGEK